MAKILIVDDALFMRKLLRDILQKVNHEIVGEAQNAKEAVEQYEKLKPDLVTLDIIMPEVDGVTSLKAIEKILALNAHAKIVMVSAMDQKSVIAEAMRAGARDFITKPFEEQDVIHAVKKLT